MTDNMSPAIKTGLDNVTAKICDHIEKRSLLPPIQRARCLAERDDLYQKIHGDSPQHARDSIEKMAELFDYKAGYIRSMLKVGRLSGEVLEGIKGSKLAGRTRDLLKLAALPLQDQLSIVGRIQDGEDVSLWDRYKKAKDSLKYMEVARLAEDVSQQEAFEESLIHAKKESQFDMDIERIARGLEEYGREAVRTLKKAGLCFASKGDVSNLKTNIDRLVKRVKALKRGQV